MKKSINLLTNEQICYNIPNTYPIKQISANDFLDLQNHSQIDKIWLREDWIFFSAEKIVILF